MPELPEVETIRLQLASVLPGKTIKDILVRSRGILHGDSRKLVGKTIKSLRRYSKMLVIDLSGGISLAVHLKMTGRLVYHNFKFQISNLKLKWEVDYPTDKHTHVVITFTNGDKLYYHDQRKFGWLQVVLTQKVANLPYVAKLGPEFLRNLTITQFRQIIKANRRPIKLVLMDQEKLAGVGNIYANEGLWCAKIHPKMPANKLLNGHMVKLFNCLEKILKQAIIWKGASENNYRDAFGGKGEVQKHFNVYEREGEPCPRPACRKSGATIKKFSLGGRGTYVCPECQR